MAVSEAEMQQRCSTDQKTRLMLPHQRSNGHTPMRTRINELNERRRHLSGNSPPVRGLQPELGSAKNTLQDIPTSMMHPDQQPFVPAPIRLLRLC
jgi:hypothetical protein